MNPRASTPRQATWNSTTNQNTSLTVSSYSYSTAVVTLQVSGTVSAGAIQYQGYDSSNFYNLRANEIPGPGYDITYSLSNGSLAWNVDVTAFSVFRVILTSVISGTGTALITITQSPVSSANTGLGSATIDAAVNLNEVGGAAFGLGQTSAANSLPVIPALSPSLVNGKTTIASSNTAVQLPSNALTQGVIVQALAANAGNVTLGNSSSQNFELQQGQATSAVVTNTNLLYINGANVGDGVCFIGS